MVCAIQPGKLTLVQMAVAAGTGAALGAMCLLGLLPAAGFLGFLAGAISIFLFRNLYKVIVLAGVVMMACVFIEPSPSDIVLAAAIPLGLATGAFRPRGMGRAAGAAAVMLAYFIVSLTGIAVSVDSESAVRYYLITFYLFLLALFIPAYGNKGNINAILRAFVLAAFISLAAGLAGLAGLFPQQLMMDEYRVRGLFKDPNVFGPFFVPAIILLLDDMKRKHILKAPKALHVAGIALLSVGVVISYSRAAWINLAVAVLVYLALGIRAFRPARLAAVAITGAAVLAVAAGLFLSSSLKSNSVVSFLQERAQLQDYDKERFGAQEGGLRMISENLLGVGPGQFENNIAGITGFELSPHSLYVRTASENGIAGFLLFFASLACIFFLLWNDHRSARRGLRAPPLPAPAEPRLLSGMATEPHDIGISPAVLLAILTGLLVNSVVVDTLHWRHFWFFIGIALYCIRETGRKVNADGRPVA